MQVTIEVDGKISRYELTQNQLGEVLTYMHDCELGTFGTATPIPRKIPPKNGDGGLYWGPMIIKCEHCGEVKGFWKTKHYPISEFICGKCEKVTQLVGLKMLYMSCDCGKEIKYRTNLEDPLVTVHCIDCGAPVELKLNSRGNAYIPVKGNRLSK